MSYIYVITDDENHGDLITACTRKYEAQKVLRNLSQNRPITDVFTVRAVVDRYEVRGSLSGHAAWLAEAIAKPSFWATSEQIG